MPYSICLLWTPEAEAVLAGIQKELASVGVPGWTAQSGHRPHIELAQVGVIEPASMKAELKKLAQGHKEFESALMRLELVGQEVVIHLDPSPQVTALHQGLHSVMKKFAQTIRPEYAPGKWSPKLSLVTGITPANLESAKPILGLIRLPWGAVASSIGVFQMNPNRMGVQAEVLLGSGLSRDRTHL